jgi:hypothetical protein
MAKIIRKHQHVFAGSLGATGNIAQFGSMAAGAKAYSLDLDTLQSLAAWSNGFAAGSPPALEDMNAFGYVFTQQLAYLMQMGISEWNASVEYCIGSMVHDGTATVYMSMANANTNNALTDATKWQLVLSNGAKNVSSLDYNVVNSDRFITVSVSPITTNRSVYLPTPATANTGRAVIIKPLAATSGGSYVPLSVKVTGGSNIDGSSSNLLSQYVCRRYVSDGTNWHVF